MARFAQLLAVALGGSLGSLARWGLLVAAGPEGEEVTLLALNGVGSLLVGVLIGVRLSADDRRYALLGTGFAGGLTTFSTFAVAVADMLDDGALGPAATYVATTVAVAVLAAGIGYRAGSAGRHRLMLATIGRSSSGARS
jgi:CrcB protein